MSATPHHPASLRVRARRSRAAIPPVMLWRALRGLPLGAEGDPPAQQRAAKRATAVIYSSLSRWLDRSGTEFMNYGWCAPDDGAAHDGEDFGIALYRRVAGAADLRDKDVLEVGSGRGGGAAFVARELGPRSVVGADLSAKAVAHCQGAHHEPNLRFVEGDAEDLPFPADAFDAVLNVESSHGYPSMRRFLGSVHRVLRPGGMFLFADVRAPGEVDGLREEFIAAGFDVLEEERITPGVVRALELDKPRREGIVHDVPRPLRPVARSFVGAEHGGIYDSLHDGHLDYVRFALRRAG